MDDAPETDDMLLMQNIFASEILILYANYFNDAKSLNLSRCKVSKVVLRVSSSSSSASSACVSTGDGSTVISLPLSPLMASIGSSRFVSIFISQASSSMWLEEQEDMMLNLINLTGNIKKREHEIFSVI